MSNLTKAYLLTNQAILSIQESVAKNETFDLAELNIMKLQAHALTKLLNSLDGKE